MPAAAGTRTSSGHTSRAEGSDGPRISRVWLRRIVRRSASLGAIAAVAYGALALAREGYEYATTDARFEVSSFVFEPTTHIDDTRLRKLLAIEAGTNILSMDLEELGVRVARDPWVAETTVVRHLPDTLEITVTEHRAAAVALSGYFYLVDSLGMPFKRLDRGERGELPIITGVDRNLLMTDRAAAAERYRGALAAIALYENKQRPQLGEIHLDPEFGVTMYTEGSGTQLDLGRSDIETGLERYDALRVALGTRADRLSVVHLDAAPSLDHRERVVARFYLDEDEAVLLAHAELRKTSQDVEQKQRAEFERDSEGSAPKKSRIPSYE